MNFATKIYAMETCYDLRFDSANSEAALPVSLEEAIDRAMTNYTAIDGYFCGFVTGAFDEQVFVRSFLAAMELEATFIDDYPIKDVESWFPKPFAAYLERYLLGVEMSELMSTI